MYSIQCGPQGTCEWQICRQQKHLHQYWNSQNRDSLRVPGATGIYRRARTKASARQSILLSAINFATYSGPRHRDYSFGPNPKVARWLMGNQYGRGRILRSAVGREETRMVMSEIGIEKRLSAEKWRCDKSVTEWEVWKSLKNLFTHQRVNELPTEKRKKTQMNTKNKMKSYQKSLQVHALVPYRLSGSRSPWSRHHCSVKRCASITAAKEVLMITLQNHKNDE